MELWCYQEQVEHEMAEIRDKALEKARTISPDIPFVVDNYTVDDYCDKVWDYPGQWYCYFKLPKGVKTKDELVNIIARETVEHFRKR